MCPERATLTVLIVDDHPSFRAVARMMLETDGFAVVGTEEDGESGVAAALRLEPDVVLLDVELPDIDGFEVAARLRAAGSRAAIVLASSRDRADFGSLVDESGARGFLTKADLSGDAIRRLVA
jgi:DNA-binding NarL/FixJ family response regulator